MNKRNSLVGWFLLVLMCPRLSLTGDTEGGGTPAQLDNAEGNAPAASAVASDTAQPPAPDVPVVSDGTVPASSDTAPTDGAPSGDASAGEAPASEQAAAPAGSEAGVEPAAMSTR